MRLHLTIAVVLITIIGCDSSPIVKPSTVSRPSTAPVSRPSVKPGPDETHRQEASAAPKATNRPIATPAPTLSPDERDLIAEFRVDAVVHCTPRLADLPPRAFAGVECRPDSDLVERVGFFRFRSDGDAALAYLERMAEYGVALNSGGCAVGDPGDSEAPIEGVPTVTFRNQAVAVYRAGCFYDENNIANYRLTCWGPALYVGILGTPKSDLEALSAWVDEGDVQTPGPAGICEPGDGLPGPDTDPIPEP